MNKRFSDNSDLLSFQFHFHIGRFTQISVSPDRTRIQTCHSIDDFMVVYMGMTAQSNIALMCLCLIRQHLIVAKEHISVSMTHIDAMFPYFQYSSERICIKIIIVALHGNKAIDIELLRMENRITAMQKTVFSRIRGSQIFQSDCLTVRVRTYDQFFRLHRRHYSMIPLSFYAISSLL